MTVDNSRAATALSKKLEASLPIKVKVAKELLKMLKTRGDIINPEKEFEVDWVAYSGDEGGIMCRLVSKNDNPEDEDKALYIGLAEKVEKGKKKIDQVVRQQQR
jgi:hypothetical protein